MRVELSYKVNTLTLPYHCFMVFDLDPLQGHLKENQEEEQGENGGGAGGGVGEEAGSSIVDYKDREQIQR